jgi:hypothetical protein
MPQVFLFLRIAISFVLIYAVYTETGVWTALTLMLVLSTIELVSRSIVHLTKAMVDFTRYIEKNMK